MLGDTIDDRDADDTARLIELQGRRWKRWLRVQAPYAWNLRRLDLGFVLDIGCGVGRNLRNLRGNAVGVDTNPVLVRLCRDQGFRAHQVDDFLVSGDAVEARYDSMLLAHVLEHMHRSEAVDLIRQYLRYLKPGGRVVAICPQERGFASDSTHVEYLDPNDLAVLVREVGLTVDQEFSFPFPQWAGRLFVYNESIVVASR